MKKLALYIHWPFCLSICPYCDFNRGIWSKAPTQDPEIWIEAYKKEITYWRKRIGECKVTSIFFGGGTPSLMPISLLAGILQHISEVFGVLLSSIEVTLEMNPTKFETEKLQEIVALGINRISVGVQSFQDPVLKFLGRTHTKQEAKNVLTWLKKKDVRFSLDLMYAHKYHEDPENWKTELKEALQWAGSHISLYQLTLERGTLFHRRAQQEKNLILDASSAADLYLWTHHYLESLGWNGYEISNYARDAEYCEHNLTYWRYEDYLGIGAGAHSRITFSDGKYAIVNESSATSWLNSCTVYHNAVKQAVPLELCTQFKEKMLMGLRLKEGVFLDSVLPIPSKFEVKIQQLKDAGYMIEFEKRLQLTIEGKLRLDGILSFLLE
ncbi:MULTISPECIES: radical SAM family heme chaperone HemW [Holospora]|uniref:Heme chaperone HemW n=2 Tax=Holospora TaxID=44747 RepID=A0A061JIR6_9PROT|nr:MULTISPECIES: radical SAM family heme chaperone HemW [Holospora]ETZ05034.1 radical S-adenosyl methionine domain-containing protein 1, mitochondrial [Holospora undulata HU1]GAJ46291.1 radical S-adenosyl methionine domain-containing protein 1, mitochondrial [Holospora elegans E1]